MNKNIAQNENHKTLDNDLLQAISQLGLSQQKSNNVKALLNAQKKREKESAQRLQTILDSVVEGILIVDSTGMIIDCNRASNILLKDETKNILNKDVQKIFVDPKATNRNKLLNKCINISSGALRYDYIEAVGKRSDGEKFPMEIIVSPANFNGENSFIYIFRDITRRKKSEEEQKRLETDLRQALKLEAIGHLAGGIAHEINTPSQYINDNLKFIQDSYKKLSSVFSIALSIIEHNKDKIDTESLQILKQNLEQKDIPFILQEIPNATSQSLEGIQQVSHIVSSMKEFSHPGTKEKSPVQINNTLKNIITIFRNEWKHNAKLEEVLDKNLPEILCYSQEINQVFLNLIINAAQAIETAGHSSDTGIIRVHSSQKEEGIVITISDNGCGISNENQEKIFNPFFTTKEVGRGTGQGLTISHDIIVNKHNGKIWFESTENKGTSFFVYLPLK